MPTPAPTTPANIFSKQFWWQAMLACLSAIVAMMAGQDVPAPIGDDPQAAGSLLSTATLLWGLFGGQLVSILAHLLTNLRNKQDFDVFSQRK